VKVAWRQCRDLSRVRLAIAVICSPLPLSSFLALVYGELGYFFRSNMVWFVIATVFYLSAACCFRARVGRLGCLITCWLAAMAYPYVGIALYALTPSFLRALLALPPSTGDPWSLLAEELTWAMRSRLLHTALWPAS